MLQSAGPCSLSATLPLTPVRIRNNPQKTKGAALPRERVWFIQVQTLRCPRDTHVRHTEKCRIRSNDKK